MEIARNSVKKITTKEALKEALRNLTKEEEFIIEIPGLYISEFLKMAKDLEVSCSRTGFKRWLFHPNKVRTNEGTDRKMVVFRLVCLASMITLFILCIYWALSLVWARLESYFVSLPVASGIVSGIILILVTLSGKFIFRKKLLILLKTYLGIYSARDRRSD